jgi:HSP20 family protein
MSLLTKKEKPGMLTVWDDLFNMPLFGEDFRTNKLVPAVNIHQDEKAYHIEFAAPGLKREDFNINLNDGLLNVWSEKKDEKVEEEKNFTRKEFSYSSFSRSFRLPDDVNPDEIEAKYKDGVLNIEVKRLANKPNKAKLIEVK